ncbi:hypothetical protein PG637_03775 [Riemerella anatipestifer]|nr:hypothetical protein [Riemerella anatipestifer]MDY3324792.1 hypothetical protein [Riemerella anatipestifer]MDY3353602.1 hypothetical protein [Riemerella anatipestifer]
MIFTILGCEKQSELILNVKKVNTNPTEELKIGTKNSGKIYEDEKFEVWRSCSGEWGGSIYFQDKKTKKIYGAISTCPVSVDKIDNIYYISNNLNHMIGYSDIIEIKNPKEMTELKTIPKSEYNSGVVTREYECRSNQGTKKLVDSIGVSIISSFISNNELYSIITSSKEEKTTISKIQNGKFITILDLTKKIVLKSNPLIEKESSKRQKIIFTYPKKTGIIEINKNEIDLILYEK